MHRLLCKSNIGLLPCLEEPASSFQTHK